MTTAQKLAKLRAWAWPLLILLITAVTVFRAYDFLRAPELRAEDGKKVFSFFYEHREWPRLFRVKAGYVPFLPNLLGLISVRLPPRATPYFLAIAPTLLAAFTASVFGAPAFRRFVPKDSVRYAVCLSFAVAPIGPMLTTSNTDYSIWNALTLLLWLVLLPLPRNKLTSVLFACALSVLIWSHPLSVVALPATLVWLWRERAWFQRCVHALLVACQGAHVWLGTRAGDASFAKGAGPWKRLDELASVTLRQVCRDVVDHVFPWGPNAAWFPYAMTLLIAVALLSCALLRKGRVASGVICAWLAYAIVAPTALIVFARAEHGIAASRYHYVSNTFAQAAVCLILVQLVVLVVRRLPQRTGVELLPALAALAYFGYLGVSTERIAAFTGANASNAQAVQRFFEQLAEEERTHGGHCGIHLRCQKHGGDWSFAIDTRGSCESSADSARDPELDH
ncbi:MAG TPA: hypothetical protein VFK05_15255 [Polyangiaceae bacterium]|nr:hypothetical protein [Polyangiaceae bacterium]